MYAFFDSIEISNPLIFYMTSLYKNMSSYRNVNFKILVFLLKFLKTGI